MISKRKIGIVEQEIIPDDVLELVDYIEPKRIDLKGVRRLKERFGKDIWLHLQYNKKKEFLNLPDPNLIQSYKNKKFKPKMHLDELREIIRFIYENNFLPWCSFHFGLSAEQVEASSETFVAKAISPAFNQREIRRNIRRNLNLIKRSFPSLKVLVENLEYQPEEVSKGAYRFIADVRIISEEMRRAMDFNYCDGLVLDIAHVIVAANNHPSYNGFSRLNRPGYIRKIELKTKKWYIERLSAVKHPLVNAKRYLRMLPLWAVKEIHISGISRQESGLWVDSHKEIGSLETELLEYALKIIKDSQNIPITLEYSRSPVRIKEQLTLLSKCLGKLT